MQFQSRTLTCRWCDFTASTASGDTHLDDDPREKDLFETMENEFPDDHQELMLHIMSEHEDIPEAVELTEKYEKRVDDVYAEFNPD